MGWTVTGCPNLSTVRARMRGFKKDMPCRLRGRGVPAGGDWREYEYSTPLAVAPRFTAYYGKAPYIRLQYIQSLPNGRVHVHYLGDQS
jgi:hypothetical protein